MLECGHTACPRCVCADAARTAVGCPRCGETQAMPAGGVAALPINTLHFKQSCDGADQAADFQSCISCERPATQTCSCIKAHFCADPQDAMARAREVKPDLILLDYLMPRLDGATLFKRLQADADLASIPVVFLTAVMTGPESRNLNQLGAAGVLVKPFDVLGLPRRLSEIWNALNIAEKARGPAARDGACS